MAALEDRIRSRDYTVGVVGLGYVGLPLALAFAEHGFPVVGFDVDADKLERLRRGESYIRHLAPERLRRAVDEGRFTTTSSFDRLGEPDAVLICVPTPLDPHRQPDLSYVEKTAAEIVPRLRRGQLVVLESTTYPGTTREVLQPRLSASGLTCGRDFFLAFSPEREDPGNPRYRMTNVPKVVGGVDEASASLAAALYAQVTPGVVRMSSADAAEATKLTENIFRAVNIALVNELKMVYDRMGVDIWEVLDAAETKPFGFMRFDPGPGWGGHCIPLDPFYLAWKAREFGVTARFVELAGETNVRTVDYVIEKTVLALNRHRKAVRGSRILLLGIAYKRDVDDPRESPAFELLERLLHLGAEVEYHDPFIERAPRMRSWPDLPPMTSRPLDPQTLAGADAVLLVTDHSQVDYELVLAHAPLIVDARGRFREPDPKVVQA